MNEHMPISKPKSEIYISLGSNISPEQNLLMAAEKLNRVFGEVDYSTVWETPPYRMEGPSFLNAAARFQSNQELDLIKSKILRKIEAELGRVRTENKYISRTIDLDILVIDSQTIEPELWNLIHLAKPLSELIPTLINPATGFTLYIVAQKLMSNTKIIPRMDIVLAGNRQ